MLTMEKISDMIANPALCAMPDSFSLTNKYLISLTGKAKFIEIFFSRSPNMVCD